MENVYARLVKLKDDPEAFSAEADTIFEDFIAGVPEERQQRLRAMHWKIQQDLRHYTDPVARLNKFIEIFYEAYFKNAGEMMAAIDKLAATAKTIDEPLSPEVAEYTRVIAFKKPGA